jgi:hypothetical protein
MKKRNFYSITLNNLSNGLIPNFLPREVRLPLIQVSGYVVPKMFPDLPEHLTPLLKEK